MPTLNGGSSSFIKLDYAPTKDVRVSSTRTIFSLFRTGVQECTTKVADDRADMLYVVKLRSTIYVIPC